MYYNLSPPSPKSCHLLDNLEKYCRTGQTTDGIYDAGALHVGNLRLHTYTQNM
jgi:hypothetical protein